jgi:uncharacterized protein YbjT (DUF2867 family)
MNKTAVVFGATGLVGKELVFELLEDPSFLKIKAIIRKPLPLSHSRLDQITLNDYSALDTIKDQLAADVYFCCIGTTIKKAGSQEEFKRIDYDIPAKIATLAESLKVSNLVIISSVGAKAETSNFYLRTKGEMEIEVQKRFTGNLKFMRPSLLLGHRGEFRLGERFAQIMMKAFGFLMIGPLLKYKAIHAWDVAWGMIKAIELPKDIVFIESDKIHKMAGNRKTTRTNKHIIK